MMNQLKYLVYLSGLAFLSLGSVLAIKIGLGVSPVMIMPYTAAAIAQVSVGVMTLAFFLFYVVLQLVFDKERNLVKTALQLPFTLFYSWFVNLFNGWIRMEAAGGFAKAGLLGVSILLTGLGVYMTIAARIVPLSPDGLAQFIARRLGIKFSLGKNLFDLASIGIALAMGLILAGRPIGIGLGTIASGLATGRVIHLLQVLVDRSWAGAAVDTAGSDTAEAANAAATAAATTAAVSDPQQF